jgi:hypothetical protein
VALHAGLGAVLIERGRGELAASVGAQHMELVAALDLAATVVNEQQDVVATSWCGWRDWPTQIAMDELEGFRRRYLAFYGNGRCRCLPARHALHSSLAWSM